MTMVRRVKTSGALPTCGAAAKGVGFSREDVAIFFMLAKISRLSQTPGHKDSLLDIGGYAALAIEADQEPFDPAKALNKLRGRK